MKVFGYINSGTNLRLVVRGVIFLTDQILLLLFSHWKHGSNIHISLLFQNNCEELKNNHHPKTLVL
jgi:hypothetical protein